MVRSIKKNLQWAWHRPVLSEIPYLSKYSTKIIQSWCLTISWIFSAAVWKRAKSDYNHTYFSNNTILNSSILFHLKIYKSNIRKQGIGIKFWANNVSMYLPAKSGQNWIPPDTEYEDFSAYGLLFTKILVTLWDILLKFGGHLFLMMMCFATKNIFYKLEFMFALAPYTIS